MKTTDKLYLRFHRKSKFWLNRERELGHSLKAECYYKIIYFKRYSSHYSLLHNPDSRHEISTIKSCEEGQGLLLRESASLSQETWSRLGLQKSWPHPLVTQTPHISPLHVLILLKVMGVLRTEDICSSMAGSEILIICSWQPFRAHYKRNVRTRHSEPSLPAPGRLREQQGVIPRAWFIRED